MKEGGGRDACRRFFHTMNVTREHLLDGLAHDDFFVRSETLGILSDAPDAGTEATHRAIAAIGKFGWKEAYEYSHLLTRLPMDAEVFEWVRQQLLRGDMSLPGDSTQWHLWKWMARAPVDILAPHRAIFEESAAPEDALPAIPRLDLAGRSVEECLALIDRTVAQCDRMKEFPHKQVRLLEHVSERLAGEAGLEDRVMDWFAFDFDREFQEGHWRAGVAIELAGRLRLDRAVPTMLEMLEFDWDWWNERIERALRRIASRGMLENVIETFPRMEWHARLFSSGALENVRFPEFEPRVAQLLEGEESDDLRVNLARASALYGTEHGLKRAWRVYLEDPGEAERSDLARLLYTFWTLAGTSHPRLADWRREFVERREGIRTSLERRFPTTLTAKADPKTGRNDPCPCGSGKKYKKCCLGKVT